MLLVVDCFGNLKSGVLARRRLLLCNCYSCFVEVVAVDVDGEAVEGEEPAAYIPPLRLQWLTSSMTDVLDR